MMKQDRIRGCLFGGAVGDALGYPVEFINEKKIFSKYGKCGITNYNTDSKCGKAIISDDTQMTLFTANGLLVGITRELLSKSDNDSKNPWHYVAKSYQDWLRTQEGSYIPDCRVPQGGVSWLLDVPQLFAARLPGNACLSALRNQRIHGFSEDYIKNPQNDRKGCGGVMRVAPVGMYRKGDIRELDIEGAQIAAITHGHSLGYMTAAVLTHIIHQIVFPEREMTLREIVLDARDTVTDIFKEDKHLETMVKIIDLAVELSENEEDDLRNIHRLGEGWIAEEALGIAIYCALRYQDDFSAAMIASVNHKGDSDSTGAIAGNILGAYVGYEAIAEKWKTDLELADVILEMADDLWQGCRMTEAIPDDSASEKVHESDYPLTPEWERKYVQMKWK